MSSPGYARCHALQKQATHNLLPRSCISNAAPARGELLREPPNLLWPTNLYFSIMATIFDAQHQASFIRTWAPSIRTDRCAHYFSGNDGQRPRQFQPLSFCNDDEIVMVTEMPMKLSIYAIVVKQSMSASFRSEHLFFMGISVSVIALSSSPDCACRRPRIDLIMYGHYHVALCLSLCHHRDIVVMLAICCALISLQLRRCHCAVTLIL